MYLPSGDQSSPPASVAIVVNSWIPVTAPAAPSKSAIQNLRAAVFVREKRKPLPIRSPARTIAILIGDEHALLSSRALLDGRDARRSVIIRIQRHDPDVRRLRIRGQIHVDRAKQHPFPIRRRHRLADRFNFIMSSKVKGCLACENAGREKSKTKRKTRRRIVSPRNKRV